MLYKNENIERGININCKKQDFLKEIFEGLKVIETRKKPTLNCYLNKKVGLIRTGCGPAELVGFARIKEVKIYNTKKEFREDYNLHQVAEGSPFDIEENGVKYGYVLEEVEEIEPVRITSRGIIARAI